MGYLEKSYHMCARAHNVVRTINSLGNGKGNCSGRPVGWEAFGLGIRLACCGGIGVGVSAAAAVDGKLSRRAGGTWIPASGV